MLFCISEGSDPGRSSYVSALALWVNEIGAARAGQFVNLMPVFGVVLAVLLRSERITASQVVGAAFVIAGILLVQRRGAGQRV